MNRKSFAAATILLFTLLAISAGSYVQAFEAEVVRVEQGNVLQVRHQDKTLELILYGIRCPAPGEPLGEKALEFTSKMVLDRKVRIQVQKREDPLKIVGSVVLPDGTLLNHKLVQNGLASWDRKAAPNDIKLQSLEDSAKELNLGLWSSPGPSKHPTRVQRTPRPAANRPPKAGVWKAIFATLLALLGAVAVVVLLLVKARRSREAGTTPATSRSVQKQVQSVPKPGPPEAERASSEAQVEAIESGREAIQDLLKSLSDFVSELMKNNVSYDNRMKDHRASIDQAMTMAGLEEIKRLLVREIEEMQSTSEDYRRQLDHANETIRDQQEVMERFKVDAKMDFLTRIANRRAFEDKLAEEFERAKRYGSIFSLIMLDIDHFKKVNDVHGHMAGDQVLRLVAQVLQDQTRFNDFVSRYGGEEFAVLLPESTVDQGRLVADKILTAVEKTSLVYAEWRIKVTLSAGVGEIDMETDTQETFVGRVDAALYQAKKNGRNRIEIA